MHAILISEQSIGTVDYADHNAMAESFVERFGTQPASPDQLTIELIESRDAGPLKRDPWPRMAKSTTKVSMSR